MARASTVLDAAPQVIGLLPEGVAVDVAAEIARRVRAKVEQVAQGVTVRSLRMVPSSTTHLDADTIEFVANATVVPLDSGTGAAPARAKVIDSVVTLELREPARVMKVVVPFLEP